jgi:hypothetical protein
MSTQCNVYEILNLKTKMPVLNIALHVSKFHPITYNEDRDWDTDITLFFLYPQR